MILVKYKNGRVLRGIVLTLGDHKIRVAIQGSDDAVEYRMVSGAWISEEIDSVTIEFEWEKRRNTIPSQDDCICDKRLAGRLIARLLNPEGDEAMSLSRV